MAELAHSASSSDDPRAALETFTYSSDVGEDEVHVGPRDEEPVLKRCVTCKDYKPLEEFCKDASRRDGKNISCKVCRNLNRRKERKEGGDDAEAGENAAQDEEPPRKRSKGMNSTSSRTAAFQTTRSEGRPTLRRAAMGCRSRKTSTCKG